MQLSIKILMVISLVIWGYTYVKFNKDYHLTKSHFCYVVDDKNKFDEEKTEKCWQNDENWIKPYQVRVKNGKTTMYWC